jgi:hypothetical protein
MKYKTLFRLALKAIGIMVFAEAIAPSMGALGWYLETRSNTAFAPASFGHLIGGVVQLVTRVYLFFGGKWIVNLAIPSNRPYCPECAYDLTGAPVERCPECGTAFRWEDVKPKIEVQSSKFEK